MKKGSPKALHAFPPAQNLCAGDSALRRERFGALPQNPAAFWIPTGHAKGGRKLPAASARFGVGASHNQSFSPSLFSKRLVVEEAALDLIAGVVGVAVIEVASGERLNGLGGFAVAELGEIAVVGLFLEPGGKGFIKAVVFNVL